MNKNNVIAILLAAALLGSTWGAVVNRQKIEVEHQLALARTELARIGTAQPGARAGRPLPAGRDEELVRANQEITALQRQIQAMEASLAACIDNRQGGGGRAGGQGTPAPALSQQLDEAKAQLLGLEKIVEEKNAALDDTAKEKERLQINTEVLLAKIADLQSELRTRQEENRQLVKGLAADRTVGPPSTPAQPAQP